MLDAFRKSYPWGLPVIGVGVVALVILLPGWVASLAATHGAVSTYSALLASANSQDLPGVERVCTKEYLASHPIRASKEGGIVGLPRNIHKNFQAWRDGPYVLLCPTNRVGPVYRFAWEEGAWKFDGPIGILQPGGIVIQSDVATGELDLP